MNDLPYANTLTQIHQQLVANFDEEELKTLCLSLGLSYDDLPASGRVNKARELVTYLARRGRLPDLRTAVATARPHAIWPGETAVSPTLPTRSDRWQLSAEDRSHLINLLVERSELRTPDRRDAFLAEMLAGSPRQRDILGQIDLTGPSRQFANQLLTVITQFGQDEPGQEVLGLLLNHLLTYIGGSPEAVYWRSLFARYPLKTNPVSTHDLPPWRDQENSASTTRKTPCRTTLSLLPTAVACPLCWYGNYIGNPG